MKQFVILSLVFGVLLAGVPTPVYAGNPFSVFKKVSVIKKLNPARMFRCTPGVSNVVVWNSLEEESITVLVGGTIYDSVFPMANRVLTIDVLKKFAGNSDRVTIIVAGGTPKGERFSMPLIWKREVRLARTQKEIDQQRTLDIHVDYKVKANEY